MKDIIGWVGMVFSLLMILNFGGYMILFEGGGNNKNDIAVVCCFLPLIIVFANMIKKTKNQTNDSK